MLRRFAKVPLARDFMLLSYKESRVRLVKSLKRSVRMQDISLALSNLKSSIIENVKFLGFIGSRFEVLFNWSVRLTGVANLLVLERVPLEVQ